MKVTLSVIKADIGGWVGHSAIHPALEESARQSLAAAKAGGLILDYFVTSCGDDLQLIMTHTKGVDSEPIHHLAWDTFMTGTGVAKKLKLYGAGQDMLADAFSGNVKGQGPGVAEMEIEERTSEPVLIFMADKTSAGSWNLPLYKMFVDPFNTAGLVIAPQLHAGFRFEIHDIREHRKIFFDTPEEIYDLLMFIGTPSRFTIKHVFSRHDGTIAAASSTERLSLIAGKYVGKDDPVMIVRSQHQFPAVGEVLEPFRYPWIIEGWMRGSHYGPLMAVAQKQATPARFDGPPRVICLGFQVSDARLIGPRDMFDDPSWDEARREANLLADHLRRHGPFEPHRLPLEEMEYTTLPQTMDKLKGRWKPL
ncbi:MAG TPA: fructose-1,6-bisphosphate aldolase/phosphatase [Candidatus Aminicenantes bacterium]|nr:fructose-1,6-bisphosphate aldolase/phosphatase [Candidatus Aminicenantes bacterium]HRY64367.1 fructose-1,6-bisphosphate aldolase/phosphatase [Candidatus Aminicenantes bacterium]HRZ71280.1 fructose-1,6-bisphosphate aldolase/phosphatase [Candidatus Aminicenantes bacterium]